MSKPKNEIAELKTRIAELKQSLEFQINLNNGLTKENERRLNEWNKCIDKIVKLEKANKELKEFWKIL